MILVCFINVPRYCQGQPINTALGIPPNEMGILESFNEALSMCTTYTLI